MSENRVIAQFFYDESGGRVKKVEDGVVSYYITEDYDIEDGEGTVYYFANGNRVAKSSDDGMFWYLDDHLGSTNVMIDSDGELVERTLYYPFGGHREGGEEKYSFTGKEFDSEIGLYYYGARYYNPETFVFTQADNVIPNVYYPQALNRYSYCYNNPLKYDDPDGHEPITATTAIALFIAGGTAIGAIIGAGIGIEKGLDDAYVRYYEADEVTSKLYMEMLKDIGKPTIGYTVEGAGAGLSMTVGTVAAIGGEVVGGPVGAIGAGVIIGGGVSALTGGFTELVWAGLEGKGLDESLDAAKEGTENGGALGVLSGVVPGSGEAASTTFEKDRGYGSGGKGHEYHAADMFKYSQNNLGSTRPQYTQAELRRFQAKGRPTV
jgi:RHS repeat-associated core domain